MADKPKDILIGMLPTRTVIERRIDSLSLYVRLPDGKRKIVSPQGIRPLRKDGIDG